MYTCFFSTASLYLSKGKIFVPFSFFCSTMAPKICISCKKTPKNIPFLFIEYCSHRVKSLPNVYSGIDMYTVQARSKICPCVPPRTRIYSLKKPKLNTERTIVMKYLYTNLYRFWGKKRWVPKSFIFYKRKKDIYIYISFIYKRQYF